MTTFPTSSTIPETTGRPAHIFPEGFVWGTATAAFQIEGASTEDGRGPSIWDVFCAEPGAVANGDDGSVACDHYHRYPEDLDLMAGLGLRNYRFSTSMSRILPDGRTPNPAGLDFYDRLVDAMLERDIAPWLTLYHWDLPAAIPGGWTNREVADIFADYARVVFDRLGDRVMNWSTLNEPWCSSFLSYACGEHAPGHTEPAEATAAAHHLLLAHGKAIGALREVTGPDHRLGITLNFTHVHAQDPDSPGDQDARRRVDGAFNRVFLDPIFRGSYPADVVQDMGSAGLGSHAQPGDMEIISTPIDFLGVNFYNGQMVRAVDPSIPLTYLSRRGLLRRQALVGAEQVPSVRRNVPRTDMGWENCAPDLRDLLLRLERDYTGVAGVPMVITENGAAYPDDTIVDGQVRDQDRADFLRGHLTAVHEAIQEGADVRGYFAWSFMDNFEWAWGYDKRFGLVHVDYDTLKRTPKQSAHYYSEVVSANGLD